MFNNSKCVLLVALFFVVCQLGYAQQYILEGTVLGNNNEPIASAVVQVDGQPVFAGTDGVYHTEKIDKSKVKVSVKMVGYNVFSQEVALNQGVNKFDIGLVQQQRDIEEVQVTGLTKVQEINRQAFTVSAIDATKLHNTTLNLSDALDRVSGVRVRETGGLGSNMNLSLNGFSGNHVRFFIDGIPMDNMGSSFQINNIPVNLAERIEVYKGVVPIWLGSDALGGAINIVTGSRSRNYVDVSYSYGSFNTHRTVVNAAATTKKGFTFQLNAYQNYSDNSYKVYLEAHNNRPEGYSKPAEVSRFHDTYHNETVIANIGVVDKPYADKLLLGITLGKSYKEIQTGVRMESVFGALHRRGNLLMPTLKYSKNNVIEGLDVTLNANFNLGTEQNIDTVNRRYDWFGDTGAELPATSGERGARTLYKYRNNEGLVTANFNYSIGEKQTITLNNVFNNFDRKGEDPLNPLNNAYELAKITRKNVLGLGYQYQESDLWSVSLFGKYIIQDNLNGDDASSSSKNLGWGTAGTYFVSPDLQLKASYELTNRMATPYELYGDVENQAPNAGLRPETSNNFNLGINYSFSPAEGHGVELTAGGFYRYAKDFIYQRFQTNQGLQVADNRDGVRTFGGDLDLHYHYGRWLNAGTSWTYQYLQNMQKYDQGVTGISPVYKDQMPNIPYFFGNTNVQVRLDDLVGGGNSLSLGYNMQYIHEFYLFWPSYGIGNKKNTVPSQLSHDLNALFSLADGRYNIGLEARNITNRRLYDNFSMQRPGRAFYVNLRYYINKK